MTAQNEIAKTAERSAKALAGAASAQDDGLSYFEREAVTDVVVRPVDALEQHFGYYEAA